MTNENEDEEAKFKRAFLVMQTTAITDSDFKPKQFSGNSADIDQDVDRWIEHFKTYVQFRGINGTMKLQLLKLLNACTCSSRMVTNGTGRSGKPLQIIAGSLS